MILANCPCCSQFSYEDCCEPYHKNLAKPATPEILMRSRYCAYALKLIDYLVETTHHSVRHLHCKSDIAKWANETQWLKLEICNASKATVEFKAFYRDVRGNHIHHEISTFKKENGIWYYLTGEFPE